MSKQIYIGMPDKNVLLSGSIIIFLGQGLLYIRAERKHE